MPMTVSIEALHLIVSIDIVAKNRMAFAILHLIDCSFEVIELTINDRFKLCLRSFPNAKGKF